MRRQAGIGYIGLLLAIALVAIFAGAAADVYVQTRQRSREAELLWIGEQFRQAIRNYYEATPGEAKTYPQNLEHLLLDPRMPGVQRHLRRLYADPMTGKADWETIMAPQGGIAGVRSRSTGTPLKQSEFRPQDAHFEGKTRYAEWEFTLLPPTPPANAPPGAQPPGAPPPR